MSIISPRVFNCFSTKNKIQGCLSAYHLPLYKKCLSIFLLLTLFTVTAFSQKKETDAIPKQLDSVDKQLQELSKTITTIKKSIEEKENNVAKKESIYGYLTFKNEAKKAKVYFKPDSLKVNEKYLNYLKKIGEDNNSSSTGTISETVSLYSQSQQNGKVTKGENQIPNDAKFTTIQIDSAILLVEHNVITRVILFSGDIPSRTDKTILFEDIENSSTYLNLRIGNKLEFVKMSDILSFVPVYDKDHVKSGIYFLSPASAYKSIALSNQ